ncbi:hypothetical protein ACIF85_25370 [Streptomyces sp. NPDC086033]|uniref:hypothetical protein n=1 Tax=Streptomyces sp. NPDC086033 TaxID=3365747 RepID=UPI0037CF1DA6
MASPQTSCPVAAVDDPYRPEGSRETFGEPAGILPGAAHLDSDAGYGSWPAVLDRCPAPNSRITPRP